jgi:hypothetical protein
MPNVNLNETNRVIGKLEEKGMVGMCSGKKKKKKNKLSLCTYLPSLA